MGQLFVERTGAGIAGLPDSCLSQEAPTGVSFRSESLSMPEKGQTRSQLRALTMYGDGLSPCGVNLTCWPAVWDLSTLEVARCVVEPGGQRFPDCSDPSAASTLEICPGGGIVRRRNRRDLPFPYCAPGVLRYQPKR